MDKCIWCGNKLGSISKLWDIPLCNACVKKDLYEYCKRAKEIEKTL